ncbi:MAG: ABC transporter ATP-binding protein, partial [Anaerolineae bacterium]|nr:ABC transporter ATP-binding protein [Anaerolineae bacterium]
MTESQLPGTVEFQHVSKRYRLGSLGTLRGTISALLARDSHENGWRQTIWALQDVGFRVEPGDALGVIGPNGSGKTTTLKLLSNITKPTSGSVSVHGRLAALIEL